MDKQDIIKSFKDSLFTGLIALALFGPIVGLRTASKGEGLFITPQWGIVFLLVGLCIFGRFLININSVRKTEFKFISVFNSKLSSITADKAKHFAITGILFAVVFPFLPFTDRYFIPKDGALMILLSLCISRIAKTSFSGSKVSIPLMIYFCLFGTALFALKVKRAHFSLGPSISYHQNLLLEGSEMDEAIDIYYQGDHLFFPNNYIHKSKKNRLLVDEPTYSTYESFNSSLAGKLSTRGKAHEKPFYLVTDGKKDPFSETSGHRSIPRFTNERSNINVFYFAK